MKHKNIRRPFKSRLKKLLGAELAVRDLSFLQKPIPISELERLQEFSRVGSHTLDKAGVQVMQMKVSSILEALGFQVRTVSGEARFGDLILAERLGRQSAKFITLITHTDTVLGNETPFTLDLGSDRAIGSGVIDNKGGVIVGLSALERVLQEYPDTEYSLRFVCSPNEEMGSIGFTEVFRQLGVDTIVGLGLEPALDNGSIIHQRRGNRWYQIDITGREAHAGRSYGEHANAAHDMAAKIMALSRLTNYSKDVSVNVGHFSGGKDRYNIICGDAHAKLDVRFASLESREQLHRKIVKILGQPRKASLAGAYATEAQWKVVDDCPPFSLTRRSKRLAQTFTEIAGQLEGRKVRSQAAGGAGDVNYLSTPVNTVLDGFGPVGGEMHTAREFVQVSSLATRAKALAGFLQQLQAMSF